jgi:hypothetical protein
MLSARRDPYVSAHWALAANIANPTILMAQKNIFTEHSPATLVASPPSHRACVLPPLSFAEVIKVPSSRDVSTPRFSLGLATSYHALEPYRRPNSVCYLTGLCLRWVLLADSDHEEHQYLQAGIKGQTWKSGQLEDSVHGHLGCEIVSTI